MPDFLGQEKPLRNCPSPLLLQREPESMLEGGPAVGEMHKGPSLGNSGFWFQFCHHSALNLRLDLSLFWAPVGLSYNGCVWGELNNLFQL